ncbi:MAG: SAM-dependent methyltransferase, partial [Acidobacteria bacterium]|nr:SAM-dependent methyltransferase [Acidobacteriota bacterium]
VRGVKQAEVRHLFPGCRISIRRVTLAPPLARVVAPVSPALYHLLSRLKFLCTHFVAWIEKP